MSQESLGEYIPRVRSRYQRMKGKQARSGLLDEFCTVSGFERKYASKVLSGVRRDGRGPGRGGAPRRYGQAEVAALTHCWRHMEQPCGKRMVGMLPWWVGHVESLEASVRTKLLAVSAATIDRLLAKGKLGVLKKPLTPRSDAAIKALVEIRAERWATREVGWTEVRCVWNRGQAATMAGLREIEAAQPFALRGIDSDGGGEFLNHPLYGYLKERGIRQTRSRPYRKNDQGARRAEELHSRAPTVGLQAAGPK